MTGFGEETIKLNPICEYTSTVNRLMEEDTVGRLCHSWQSLL